MDQASGPALLTIDNLTAGYGKLPVLHGVSLSVDKGGMVAVIGPNGAGKSTLMKAIMGQVDIMGGSIDFAGTRISALPANRIAALGIGYVPQVRNVFAALSVSENLELSCNLLPRAERADAIASVIERFPRLKERLRQAARSLSGGERQMLAIGSALLSRPQLLILDEPVSGLSPFLTDEVGRGIADINKAGVTVVWVVEENPMQVIALADWVYVMDGGRVRLSQSAADTLKAADFRELFLGV